MRKKKNTVLIVDDQGQTYKLLSIILDKNDFEIVGCESAKRAVSVCISIRPDIVLLDLDMPGINGCALTKSIREWLHSPIIIISERSNDIDIIGGLTAGADDYVIKPFNTDVLCARIMTALRKSVVQETGESELSNGPLRMDLVRHEVFIDERLVALTPKEYKLFRYFMIHCGKMLGHRQILNEVWGPAHVDDTQYLRVFVGQIREKIEKDPANPSIITTEPGVGYRMESIHTVPPPLQHEIQF